METDGFLFEWYRFYKPSCHHRLHCSQELAIAVDRYSKSLILAQYSKQQHPAPTAKYCSHLYSDCIQVTVSYLNDKYHLMVGRTYGS